MTSLQLFETLCGVIMIFVGWRFICNRKIAVVSEGGQTPLGWIKGRDTVIAGVVVITIGLCFLAAAAGMWQLP